MKKNSTDSSLRLISTGFTLVEILVVLGILSIIAWSFWQFGADIFIKNYFFQASFSAEQETKATMKKIIRELRSAGQAITGDYVISQASATELIFFSDVDGDGLRERLRYFVDGQTLKRSVTSPSGQPYSYNPTTEKIYTAVRYLVTDNQPVFIYYDGSFDNASSTQALAEPIDIAKIRLVEINLSIQVPRSNQIMSAGSRAVLRTIKDNY